MSDTKNETRRRAEIVAIGSELTSGARLDTNSQWLSTSLAAIGLPVVAHTTIADDMPVMVETFRRAVDRSDVVLVTGGLGPTLDDLTRQALAETAGVDLVLDEPSLAHVRNLFERRGRTMPERNRLQAMFPAGSEPISNPRGTAPGVWMTFERAERGPCVVAAMPGVPSEMKRMFDFEILPRLGVPNRVIRHGVLKCFGAGESHMEELLGDLTARGREPEVGITAHAATISLRITAQGPDVATCEREIAVTKHEARERLGDLVFGENDEELWDVLVPQLRSLGKTLSTVESGTGGLLAHLLTEVPGHAFVHPGGLVVPTDDAKRRLLQFPEELLNDETRVSRRAAETMATTCRNLLRTDFALAITECPVWDPDDANAEIPEAYVALARADGVEAHAVNFVGDPSIRKIRTAKVALNLLRKRLAKSD